MTIWYKIDGAWVDVDKPWIKVAGVQRPAQEVFVKRSGVWTSAFEFDTTPSSPPELSLQIIDNRFIKVGTRLPGPTDADLKRIRILVSRDAMPSTQFGSGFVAGVDDTFPDEPWSEWYYNNTSPAGAGLSHGVTNEWDYKQYPLNPNSSTNLPGDKFYYFAAWSEDRNGNWSVGNFTKIFMPKNGTPAPHVIVKEARVQADFAGSAALNGASYVEGALTAQESPQSNGFWFYGNQITQIVGEQGTPTIKNARVRVTRTNDGGVATANVNLFWHEARNPGEMPVLNADRHNITLVGTLNKGESDWLDIPNSFFSHFNTEIKGLGLAYGIQASDFIVASDLSVDLRCGEVEIVWEEAL